MADSEIALPRPPQPRRRIPAASIVLPPLLLLGLMFMGAGIVSITLRPLRMLELPYPKLLDWAHVIAPAACALLWLVTLWRWPRTGSIVAVLLCHILISMVPPYADTRVARVPVSRVLTATECDNMESRAGFKVFNWAVSGAGEVLVAPQHESAMRIELEKMGILVPPAEKAGLND